MRKNKLAVGIWTYGTCSERYVGQGYKPFMNFDERVQRIGTLQDNVGIEINYPNDLDEENFDENFETIKAANLVVAAVNVELVCDPYWQYGSFTSFDPSVREEAIARTKRAMDVAKKSGCNTVNLWLGLDGFDYVFERDYSRGWQDLVEGIRECASYREDINLSIEYKISEPNMKCYVNSAGKALALSLATGCANVGVTLDFGHSLNANENPAESAAMLLAENRLFHVHVNDNYGISDDDMPVGTVHWPQLLEFIYWLDKLDYNGFISMDLYPYRDDAQTANQVSIDFIRYLEDIFEDLKVDFFDGSRPKGMSIYALMRAFRGDTEGKD